MSENVRINKFDNLKGLAIFLIVLGHVLYIRDFSSVSFLHNLIFIFNLPVFFFVAGYFSKINLEQPVKIFKRVMIPYLIFSLLFFLFYLSYDKHSISLLIFPAYGLWFLLAIFFMKMSLPIWNKLKYPLLFSFILALGIGFMTYNKDFFGLRRTFAFLPVFIIGFFYRDYKLKIENNYHKIAHLLENRIFVACISLVVIFLSISVAVYVPLSTIKMDSFYMSPKLLNMLIRLLVIILGIAITLILNKFMTNDECILTKWGKNSMAIYLFHLFIVKILKKSFTTVLSAQNELFVLLFSFSFSLIVVLILSSDRISKYYNLSMDGIANFILKE